MFESLENRRLLSVSLHNGHLNITGTRRADNIELRVDQSHLIVSMGARTKSFALADISFIKATGGNGNDSLEGNAGDDSLEGGNDDDSLEGNAGNDDCHGGAGNDSITGGQGHDHFHSDDDSTEIDDKHGNDNVLDDQGNDGP